MYDEEGSEYHNLSQSTLPSSLEADVSADHQRVELEKRIMVNEKDFLNNLTHRVNGNLRRKFGESWIDKKIRCVNEHDWTGLSPCNKYVRT